MDVLLLARKLSGLSNQEIAQRLGQRSVGTYFSTRSNDFPSFPQLPAFCLALGNDLPLAWLLAQVEGRKREAGNGGAQVAPGEGKPWHDKVLDLLLAASRQASEAGLVARERLANPAAASCDDLVAAEDAILKAVQDLVAAREILKARRRVVWTGPDIKFQRCGPKGEATAASDNAPFVWEAEEETAGGRRFLSFCRRLLFWRR